MLIYTIPKSLYINKTSTHSPRSSSSRVALAARYADSSDAFTKYLSALSTSTRCPSLRYFPLSSEYIVVTRFTMNHPSRTSIVSPHVVFFGSLCTPNSLGGGVATRTANGTNFVFRSLSSPELDSRSLERFVPSLGSRSPSSPVR